MFEPSLQSLSQHPVPEWFRDAKLGIMISWGLYSIPGWAKLPNPSDPPPTDPGTAIANTPYAEWYLNSVSIADSPTQQYHRATYGERDYASFTEEFAAAVDQWDPAEWVDVFAAAGARYLVPLAKHHDGFLLWPSTIRNPHRENWSVSRDVLGELRQEATARGLRFGVYYSGGVDWSFWGLPFQEIAPETWIPPTEEYATYADAHWRELVDRYAPDVLWNDIGYPDAAQPYALFADYYNAHPDGVVNDRFADYYSEWLSKDFSKGRRHYDVRTPEYSVFDEITPDVWETCRGVGHSFGYNRQETEQHTLPSAELIWLLADVVSKNGNLLLGVGPDENGHVSAVQRASLSGLGSWLTTNGEAIYGTRPWSRHAGQTETGAQVRFTTAGDDLYAIVQGPAGPTTVVRGLHLESESKVEILGGGAGQVRSGPTGTVIEGPAPVGTDAFAIKMTGATGARYDG